MWKGNLTKNVKITPVGVYRAAATTVVDSDTLDMAGYDAVTFIQTQVDNASVFTVIGSDTAAATATAMTAFATPTVTTTATSQTVVLEVNRPVYRYLKVHKAEGVSGIIGPCIAIQTKARDVPITNENAAAAGVRVSLANNPT